MADTRPSLTSNYRVDFGAADVHLQRGSVESGQSALGELDEETIRWGVLITRVMSIILLVLIIIAVCMGATRNHKLLILAGVFGCVLIIVFMCSFVDLEIFRSTTTWRGRFSVFNRQGSFMWPMRSSTATDIKQPINSGPSSSTVPRL